MAEAAGWTQSRLSYLMGVSENTVYRWMRKAKADGEGREDPKGREPSQNHLLHVRAILAVHTGTPAMLAALRGPKERFAHTLAAIPKIRLSWEPLPDDAVVYDGDSGEVYGVEGDDGCE